VVTTVPVDLAVSLAVGASFAYASRRSVEHESLLRAPSLWALVAFELFVFAPGGAYLLWRYPDWCYMYLIEAGTLGIPDPAVALVYPIAALAAYFPTRSLLVKQRPWVALGIAMGGLVLAAAIVAFGHRQLSVLGTTEGFRGNTPLAAMLLSPLPWALGGVTITGAAAWVVSLWRLAVFGRAAAMQIVTYEYEYEDEDEE
jgi:hypothetical protein